MKLISLMDSLEWIFGKLYKLVCLEYYYFIQNSVNKAIQEHYGLKHSPGRLKLIQNPTPSGWRAYFNDRVIFLQQDPN